MFDYAKLKTFFLYTFIGALIVAALVAVITVLIGQFNEVTWRVFFTLFIVIAHALVCLAFIWDDTRRNTFDRLAFFINTVFLILILSFVTCVFATWQIISTETFFHLYTTYFYIAFASLHGDILSKALGKEKYMDAIVYANYVCMAIVVLMLQPIIYTQDAITVLGGLYFRSLAAVSIVDGTLSILTIIFYKLFMHKHPELENILHDSMVAKKGQLPRKGLSLWVWILFIYLGFQVLSLATFVLRGMTGGHMY